jgi:hypothetical protein
MRSRSPPVRGTVSTTAAPAPGTVTARKLTPSTIRASPASKGRTRCPASRARHARPSLQTSALASAT